MITFFGLLFWLVITSGVILYVAGAFGIDFAQRKAWADFAGKYKLSVTRGRRFFDPVAVGGNLNGRTIAIYTQIEQMDAERLQRRYAQVEVYLNAAPATRFIFSKKPLPADAGDIEFNAAYPVNGIAVARTDDAAVMAAWMNEARLRALTAYMDFCGGDEAMLIGTGDEAFLLWRTQDPLNDARALNALVQKLYGFAKDIEAAQPSDTSAKPKGESVSTSPAKDA